MLIDETYFEGIHTEIAGINKKDNSSDDYTQPAKERRRKLRQFIDLYEPEFLRKLLGDSLAEVVEIETEIVSLLRNEKDKTSPIANYVFFKFTPADQTKATRSGEKVKTSANSEIVAPKQRMIESWNAMVDKCRELATRIEHDDFKPDYRSDIFDYVNQFNI